MAGGAPPAYLWIGEAEVLKEEALERLRRGRAVRKLFAGEAGVEEILVEQRNLSLLDPVGAVVVRNAAKLDADECGRLLESLEPPEGAPPLVFWDATVDRRRKLFQEIARRGGEKEFAAPRDADAVDWVRREAQRLGTSIEPGAATLIVELLGGNLRRLRTTLEMLALAVGDGRAIDRDTVVALVPEARSHALYELQDELTARRARPAVRLLREALDRGDAPEMVLGGLYAQLRRLLFARALRAGEKPELRKQRLVSEAGTPPFKADGLLAAAARIPESDLRRAFAALGEIDRGMKRGRIDGGAALEGWLVDFCSSGGAAR